MVCVFIAHKKSAETKTEKTDRKMLKHRLFVLCIAPLRVEGGFELVFVDCCIVMERSLKYSTYSKLILLPQLQTHSLYGPMTGCSSRRIFVSVAASKMRRRRDENPPA
jgi:hypothetical protein